MAATWGSNPLVIFVQGRSWVHSGQGGLEIKKWLLFFPGIVSLALLISCVVFAEPTHPNEVGLYTTPDGYGETGTFIMGVPVETESFGSVK